jgi:hypothetical protein
MTDNQTPTTPFTAEEAREQAAYWEDLILTSGNVAKDFGLPLTLRAYADMLERPAHLDAALHELDGTLPCSNEECACCAAIWPKVKAVLDLTSPVERPAIDPVCSSPVHWFGIDVPADGNEKCVCGEETFSENLATTAHEWKAEIERLRARAADLVEERERMRGFAINPESLAKRIASTCFSNEYEGDPERIANAIRDYLYIGRNQDA